MNAMSDDERWQLAEIEHFGGGLYLFDRDPLSPLIAGLLEKGYLVEAPTEPGFEIHVAVTPAGRAALGSEAMFRVGEQVKIKDDAFPDGTPAGKLKAYRGLSGTLVEPSYGGVAPFT